MGPQHMLELRGEKDGFVNVNSVFLIVIGKNQYSKSSRKALLIVLQMVLHFILL